MKPLTKRNSKQKPRFTYSAEHLSMLSGRPIADFPNNPRATQLRSDHIVDPDQAREVAVGEAALNKKGTNVVTSVKLISDDSSNDKQVLPAPAAVRPSEGRAVKGKGKKASNDDVSKALRIIGGELTMLSAPDRMAVLKKLNGTFGYVPKGGNQAASDALNPNVSGSNSQPAKASSKPNSRPKDPHNEAFQDTVYGKVLKVTSRAVREHSTSTSIKCTEECHFLHKSLLSMKAEFRDKLKTEGESAKNSLNSDVDASKPEEVCKRWLAAIRLITTNTTLALDSESAPSILEGAWCLSCGRPSEKFADEEWAQSSPDSWAEVTTTVPRTDEETALANTRNLERKASKKAKKAEKKQQTEGEVNSGGNPKGPVRISDPGDTTMSEANPEEGISEGLSGVVLEESAEDAQSNQSSENPEPQGTKRKDPPK